MKADYESLSKLIEKWAIENRVSGLKMAEYMNRMTSEFITTHQIDLLKQRLDKQRTQ